MQRTIVVGDVHGCIDELEIAAGPKGAGWQRGDRLVLVGDIVAKGPDSAVGGGAGARARAPWG